MESVPEPLPERCIETSATPKTTGQEKTLIRFLPYFFILGILGPDPHWV